MSIVLSISAGATSIVIIKERNAMFGEDNDFISCVNGDSQMLPTPFQYTSINVAGPDLNNDPNELIYSGCECRLPSCDQNCPCIQRYRASYTETGKFITNSDVMNLSKPVLECNTSCKCSSNCINRVVQNGIRFQLQVFPTSYKGWGLQSKEKIPANSFVCEYAGEIITTKQAKVRTKNSKDDMNYILVVRENLSHEKMIQTIIDPTRIGNVGRFINHSCDPNLYQVIVRIDNEIPRVALFAARDIELMEELTYSYRGCSQMEGCEDKADTPCHCGAKNCTGFLPFDKGLF